MVPGEEESTEAVGGGLDGRDSSGVAQGVLGDPGGVLIGSNHGRLRPPAAQEALVSRKHSLEQGLMVQAGGLSGTFARLDMIAKEIDINGGISMPEQPIALNAGVTTTVLKHATNIPTPGADQDDTIYYTPIPGACDTSTPNTAACG